MSSDSSADNQNDLPTVSVIIPAYNAADTIERAIHSLMAQTYPVQEIIVIDDGSQDQTVEIAQAIDGPIRVIQQQNAGPGLARNRGAQEATSEWLGFLDADDAWLPNLIADQLPYVKLGYDHLCGRGQGFEDEIELLFGELTFDLIWGLNYVGTSGSLVRKSCFDAVGGFSDLPELRVCEDYNLWLRLLLNGAKFYRTTHVVFEYTPDQNSLSANHARMYEAEKFNLNQIAQLAELPPERLEERLFQLADEYSYNQFQTCDLIAARPILKEMLALKFSWKACMKYYLTFLPGAAHLYRLRLKLRHGPDKISNKPDQEESLSRIESAALVS